MSAAEVMGGNPASRSAKVSKHQDRSIKPPAAGATGQ
jgi:hypothetical protein